MKLIHKMPQSDEQKHLELIDHGWILLKEPKTFLLIIIVSIPLMIINTLICLGAIHIFSDITFQEFGIASVPFTITIDLGVILGIFLILVIHELIHLMFVPNFIKSRQTFIGLTIFGGFVYTEEEISKTRYIIITIAPFIILSILLPIILGLFGLLTTTLKFFILLNAASSSVDMFILFLLLSQVPKDSILKSNGMKTYWKSSRASETNA